MRARPACLLGLALLAQAVGCKRPSTDIGADDASADVPSCTKDARVIVDARAVGIDFSIHVSVLRGCPRLRRRLALERDSGGTWVDVLPSHMGSKVFSIDCSTSGPSCVETSAGVTFNAGTWLAMPSGAALTCPFMGTSEAKLLSAAPGLYRIVAHGCDGAERFESRPFEVRVRERPEVTLTC